MNGRLAALAVVGLLALPACAKETSIVVRTGVTASPESAASLVLGALRLGCEVRALPRGLRVGCGGGARNPQTLLREVTDSFIVIELDGDPAKNEPYLATCKSEGAIGDCKTWIDKVRDAGKEATPSPTPAPHEGEADISASGAGPVRFKMSVEEVATALKTKPDKIEGSAPVITAHFHAKGMIGIFNDGKLMTLFLMSGHGEGADKPFSAYVGHMSNGLSVDANLYDVITKMGVVPSTATPRIAVYALAPAVQIQFSFDAESRLTSISLHSGV